MFLGNVLGDPVTHEDFGNRMPDMLREAARLVTEEGKIVVRETISPLPEMTEDAVAQAGLHIDLKVTRADEEQWAALEELYTNHRTMEYHDLSRDFYLVLSKPEQAA